MRSLKQWAGGLVVLAVLVSGCSDDADEPEGDDPPSSESASPTSSTSSTSEAPSDAVVEELVRAFASLQIARLTQALDLTQPDSLAYKYTDYQRALANANLDSGAGTGTTYDPPEQVEGGWRICPPAAAGDECVTWADFEGTDGKVSGFTVNGVDISSHIAAGDGSEIRIGRGIGSVKVLYSYESAQSSKLAVVLEVKAEDQHFNLGSAFDAVYRDPSAGRITVDDAVVPKPDLEPGNTATIVLLFPPPAKIGGTASFDIYDVHADPHVVSFSTS
jgi:hypothetical protein